MASDLSAEPHRAEPRARWWRRAPRIPTLALFAVVAMALLGTFTLIFATVEAERVQREQANRTSGVLAALNGIVTATINGETAQRGYFITADRRYLEPYYRGRADYQRESAALRERLGDENTERQQALLDEIDRLGDAKWAEMGGTVKLVGQGRMVDAQVRLLSDEGKLAMDGLRSAVRRLDVMERSHLDNATARAAQAESRILPSLALLFVVIVLALGLGLWQAIRTAQAEAAAANADAIAQARDRADLLAKELNHRVKNLFAVILAIVKMSARGDAGAAPAVDRIAKRIHALVTAHDVTQGSPGESHVDLAELVGKALAPYRSASERCEVTGRSLVIPGRHAVPLGLVLHELVTNAVKYGAWSQPGGLLVVDWREEDGRVRVTWTEQRASPLVIPDGGKPGREGFGSMLIRSSERQLGGKIARRFEAYGIVVEMDFPRSSD